MTAKTPDAIPLPQAGGCYVVQDGKLLPEAEHAAPQPTQKPAVKPASKEA